MEDILNYDPNDFPGFTREQIEAGLTVRATIEAERERQRDLLRKGVINSPYPRR